MDDELSKQRNKRTDCLPRQVGPLKITKDAAPFFWLSVSHPRGAGTETPLERNDQRQGKDEGKERPILASNPKDGPSLAFFGLFVS
jgi:hypothetical protein